MNSINGKIKFKLSIIAIIFIFSLVQGQGIDNGDWHRTAGVSAGIIPEPWQAFAASYSIQKEQQPQPFSIGILAAGISYLMKDMGINYFPSALVFAILNIVFATGVIVLAETFDGPKKILSTISILLTYLCFGFYEKSLYEEAVILPLLPWIFIGAHLAKTQERYFIYTLAGIFISIAKMQMLFCVPFFIFFLLVNSANSGISRKSIAPLALLAIVPFYTTALLSEDTNKIYNNYNRFYNGVGWAILDSHAWPGREFNQKKEYFYQNRENLQNKIIERLRDTPHEDLLGTSFWPTGEALLKKTRDGSMSQGNFAPIINQGDFKTYITYIAKNPGVFIKITKNTYLTAIKSNYTLEYLQTPPPANFGIFKSLQNVKNGLCTVAGIIFFATILLTMIFFRRLSNIFMGFYFLLLPLMVVFGDGYYEFEKHMIPYMILLPAFVFLSVISKNFSHGNCLATRSLTFSIPARQG